LVFYGGKIWTRSNVRLYDERRIKIKGKEYREWDPSRSKVAAIIKVGNKFQIKGPIIYIGCAEGQTLSHIADITSYPIVGVDISASAMVKMLKLSGIKENVIPFLGEVKDLKIDFKFRHFIQDVSQKDQAAILISAIHLLEDGATGWLFLKTRSINSVKSEKGVLKEFKKQIRKYFEILKIVDIQKYHAGHYALFLRLKSRV